MSESYGIKINTWYMNMYPEDKLGKVINKNAVFRDVVTALNEHEDLYKTLGTTDRVIRERVFKALAKIMQEENEGVNYESIFQTYLGNRETVQG